MSKKTRLILFDYEKYKAGAKAVCRHSNYKVLEIFERYNSTFPYLGIFSTEELGAESRVMLKNGKIDINEDDNRDIFLEEEIEEKTIYVNVYDPFPTIRGTEWKTIEEATHNRATDCIGTLKVTYTDEDLIK